MKKMAYAAPLVLSLAASPAFASSGSSGDSHNCHRGSKSPGKPGTQSINNRRH
jgi:hypothetical protein